MAIFALNSRAEHGGGGGGGGGNFARRENSDWVVGIWWDMILIIWTVFKDKNNIL